MSNQPNYRRAPSLAEFAEKRYAEGSIEIEMPDGDPIVVPPGEFWTEATRELQRKLRKREATTADVATSVIGEEAFGRIAVAVASLVPGMDPGDFFFLYLTEVTENKQGETPGK